MSRSGYTEECDGWQLIMWRGAVTKAIKGKRGQQFLKDLLNALDEMPVKRLIADDFVREGEVCTIASLGQKRGIDMSEWDPEDCYDERPAMAFGIAPALVREIENENDEFGRETPEERWVRMRKWIVSNIKL